MRQWAQDTRRRADGRPVYYTEWNASSNPRDPRHDEPYAAAFAAKTALEASGIAEGYSFWTFSDIFEENYFPSVPFHGGFGLLTLHGIAKPVYRAFQLLHELGDERLLVDGLHQTVDAWVVQSERRRDDPPDQPCAPATSRSGGSASASLRGIWPGHARYRFDKSTTGMLIPAGSGSSFASPTI